jgi:hypothetical protein
MAYSPAALASDRPAALSSEALTSVTEALAAAPPSDFAAVPPTLYLAADFASGISSGRQDGCARQKPATARAQAAPLSVFFFITFIILRFSLIFFGGKGKAQRAGGASSCGERLNF